MRFEQVLERWVARPTPLPAAPSELEPRILGRVAEGHDTVGRAGPPGARDAGARDAAARDAAALVLLYPDAEREATVVLIERASGRHVHAGQVALPGGKRDVGDDYPAGTALREAAEEVGLDAVAARVTVAGLLDVVDVRASGHLMVPVLATAPSVPALSPERREVARLLRVPVRHFLAGAPIELVDDVRDGWRLRYGAYRVGDALVWGATARVLGQLGAILGGER
jgi:8-oxo-dGTP pyrophosphatase MutT (NUDIX family)